MPKQKGDSNHFRVLQGEKCHQEQQAQAGNDSDFDVGFGAHSRARYDDAIGNALPLGAGSTLLANRRSALEVKTSRQPSDTDVLHLTKLAEDAENVENKAVAVFPARLASLRPLCRIGLVGSLTPDRRCYNEADCSRGNLLTFSARVTPICYGRLGTIAQPA
jgi:hypothetical protein